MSLFSLFVSQMHVYSFDALPPPAPSLRVPPFKIKIKVMFRLSTERKLLWRRSHLWTKQFRENKESKFIVVLCMSSRWFPILSAAANGSIYRFP
jgi:hypothetical protein